MNNLSVALNSLDPMTFQRLVFDLLKEMHPNLAVNQVEGKSGDEGIDIVAGNLGERPIIWQCKRISERIGASQKQKIRGSLNRALKLHSPRKWILCLSIDPDPQALRWLQRLAQSRSGEVEMATMFASDIIHELHYRQTLVESYFPGIVLSTSRLREIAAKTTDLSDSDFNKLAEGNVSSYLARLQEKDPRFAYQIAYGRDTNSVSPPPAGTIATISSGAVTTHVLPRNIDAIRMNPPTMRIKVRGEGARKLLDSRRTGKKQVLTGDELIDFKSDFDFLFPKHSGGITLTIAPNASSQTIPLRVAFGNNDITYQYELIEFQTARAGTDEVLFESVSALPFRISLLYRTDRTGNLQFGDQIEGHSPTDALRMAEAIIAACSSGYIELYDLKKGKRLGRFAVTAQVSGAMKGTHELLSAAARIEQNFGVILKLPAQVSEPDIVNIDFLSRLIDGTTVTGGELSLSLSLNQDQDRDDLRRLADEPAISFIKTDLANPMLIFGTHIPVGPIYYQAPKIKIKDRSLFLEHLKNMPLGSIITAHFEPIEPVSVTRVSVT